MIEYSEQDIINKRNIQALNEGLKHLERMRAQDANTVSSMCATVSDLVQQVQALTIQLALLRANAMGHGAS